MDRRTAREYAFMLIYEMGFHKDLSDATEVHKDAEACREVAFDEYTDRVFFGTLNELETIDKKIEENSKGWKADRITRVSRAIMRLCVYEMLFCEDIPFSVSINEAVELAKKYDHEKAPSFINGVVNNIAEVEGLKK